MRIGEARPLSGGMALLANGSRGSYSTWLPREDTLITEGIIERVEYVSCMSVGAALTGVGWTSGGVDWKGEACLEGTPLARAGVLPRGGEYSSWRTLEGTPLARAGVLPRGGEYSSWRILDGARDPG